jgi:hypothetical protein
MAQQTLNIFAKTTDLGSLQVAIDESKAGNASSASLTVASTNPDGTPATSVTINPGDILTLNFTAAQ